MRILTVSEFLSGVNDVLSGVPAIVEGEVSGFSVRQAQWAFFSLKDAESIVECFMPAWKLHVVVEDGMLVRIAGLPRVYEKTGRFRITVERLELSGDGSLRRAFELLKQQLDSEGLFAPERKRALPRFPETIGLITSHDAAAYSDFLRILQNRWGGVRVLHQDVRVQGDGAVEDICAALRVWDRPLSLSCEIQKQSHGGETERPRFPIQGEGGTEGARVRWVPEVIVLTRGGGSLDDLQAFNSEAVARAIFASPVPVVVGVGHERDVSIADLVADVRASTPSNAAELVVPDRRDVAAAIDSMVGRVQQNTELAITSRQAVISRFLLHGHAFAARCRARVDAATVRLRERIAVCGQRMASRIDAAERLIGSLNPNRLLARGYSMTTVNGRILRDASDVKSGDAMTTRLANGSVASTVTATSRS